MISEQELKDSSESNELLHNSHGINYEQSETFESVDLSKDSKSSDSSYDLESEQENEESLIDSQERLDQITKEYQEYKLDDLQSSKATDYFQKVMFRINLDSLYKVVGSCINNATDEFCPVLVKIVQPRIIDKNDGCQYLLQIWSKQGELVFERKLKEPVANWSFSSGMFLFQEEIGSCSVFIVKVVEDLCPTLFEVVLPKATFYKQEIGQVPKSLRIHRQCSSTKNAKKSPTFKRKEMFRSKKESIFNIPEDQNIRDQNYGGHNNDFAEDFMEYQEGFVIVGTPSQVIYFNFEELIQDVNEQKDGPVIKIAINPEEVHFFTIQQNFKLNSLLDLGCDKSALVLENSTSHQLRFFKINIIVDDYQKTELKLVQLGLMVNMQEESDTSPIMKQRALVTQDANGNFIHRLLVLRKSGRINFYSDFMLINEDLDRTNATIDIESGLNQFFLLRQDAVTKKLVQHEYLAECFRLNKFRDLKSESDFELTLHNRIAPYFNLYSCFTIFKTYFIVAHRNHISVFDVVRAHWKSMKTFSGNVRYVEIKKMSKPTMVHQSQITTLHVDLPFLSMSEQKYKKDYSIMVQEDNNRLHFMKIEQEGKLVATKEKSLIMEGRILKVHNATRDSAGILFLVEKVPCKPLHIQNGVNEFNTFELKRWCSRAIQELQILKYDQISTLVTSQQEPVCMARDSDFMVYNVHSGIEKNKSQSKRKQHNLIITSKMKQVTKTIPLTFDLVPMLDLEQGVAFDPCFQCPEITEANILDTFSLHQQADQEKVDNWQNLDLMNQSSDFLVQVTDMGLKVFHGNGDIKLIYTGIRIRNCVSISDEHMFCIQDEITEAITLHTPNPNLSRYQKSQLYLGKQPKGLFIYDCSQLLLGKLVLCHLSDTVVGASKHFCTSLFSKHVSFTLDFNQIAMSPFPHLNIYGLVGISHKKEYVIWREAKGYFTALNRQGNLLSWSLGTGKLIRSEKVSQITKQHGHFDYHLYKGDNKDDTYMRDNYNFEDRSITLLVGAKLYMKRMICGTSHESGHTLTQIRVSTNRRITISDLMCEAENKVIKAGQNVELIDKQQKIGLFHFKVVELQSYADNQTRNEVKVLFNFFFQLIMPRNREGQRLQEFSWNYNKDPSQRIYLSKDTSLLMEVINNKIAIVYERTYEDNSESKDLYWKDLQQQSKLVKWHVLYRIWSMPTKLVSTGVKMFSPNFRFQLDFQHENKQVIIRETKTQEIYCPVSNEILSQARVEQEIEMNQSIEAIISFPTDDHIRVVDNEQVECIFELKQTGLKLISQCKLDNNLPEQIRLLEHIQIQDPVLLRLIKLNQKYKSWITHTLNTNNALSKEVANNDSLLANLFKINYEGDWENPHAKFDVETTFTWLDWRIIDLLISQPNYYMNEHEQLQKLQLCFNILPRAQTVFHKLTCQTSKKGIKVVKIVQQLFDIAKTGLPKSLLTDNTSEESISFEIPIIKDMYGQCPLDYSLGIFKKRRKKSARNDQLQQLFDRRLERKQFVLGYSNMNLAQIIFENIKDYSFMHSGSVLVDAINVAFAKSIPGIADFLDCRVKVAKFNSKYRNELKRDVLFSDENQVYGVTKLTSCTEKSEIKKIMFSDKGPLMQMELSFLDVPMLFSQTKEGYEFIHSLDVMDNKSLSVFGNQTVQRIINEQWRRWKGRYYIQIVGPYLLLLTAFEYSSAEKPVGTNLLVIQIQLITTGTILVTLSIYFLIIELIQLFRNPKKQISSLTALFQVLPSILILAWCTSLFYRKELGAELGKIDTLYLFKSERAIISLFIWLKFILLLRSISYTSYLVQMIRQVFTDIRVFILILFLTFIAFADAQVSVHNNYNHSFRYIFLITIGMAEVDQIEDDPLGTAIFALTALFNLIVMLNLLIAIISETYENVKQDKDQFLYKLKVQIISTLQSINFGVKICGKKRHMPSDPTILLFFAQPHKIDSTKERNQANSNMIKQMQDMIEDSTLKIEDSMSDLNDLMTRSLTTPRYNGQSLRRQGTR